MDTVVRLPAAAFVSLAIVRRRLGPRNRELHASDTFGNFESCYPLAAVEHVRHKSVGELGIATRERDPILSVTRYRNGIKR